MIMTCTCKHSVQDQLHGTGKRVFNRMKNGQYKCTVCKAVKGDAETKKENK